MKGFVFYLAVVFMLFVPEINSTGSQNDSVILSRRKRYVAFPDGSTLIFAFCMTAQVIIPNGIFTEGVNWGIAYDLPNRTAFSNFVNDGPDFLMKRRHRRDLYSKVEVAMNSMGYDGRSCIYRALCEASRLYVKSPTLMEKLVRVLFKFPQQNLLESEPEEHRLYHWAYRKGRENKQQDCAEMFAGCSISLIDMALGYYNDYMQEPNYDASHLNR